MTVSIDSTGTTLSPSESRPQVSVRAAKPASADFGQVTVSDPHRTGVTDTVELSVLAHIQMLVRQGVSVDEIANTLGLTAALVNSYLFVPVAPSNAPVTNPVA